MDSYGTLSSHGRSGYLPAFEPDRSDVAPPYRYRQNFLFRGPVSVGLVVLFCVTTCLYLLYPLSFAEKDDATNWLNEISMAYSLPDEFDKRFPNWIVPSGFMKFDGVFLGEILGMQHNGHVNGDVVYMAKRRHVKFYTGYKQNGGKFNQFWEIWHRHNHSSLFVSRETYPNNTVTCNAQWAYSKGWPGLGSFTDLPLKLNHTHKSYVGAYDAEVWQQNFPNGFPDSAMPKDSSLLIWLQRHTNHHSLALPIYHSLNSPQGEWAVDIAFYDLQPSYHVPHGHWVIPKDCFVPAPPAAEDLFAWQELGQVKDRNSVNQQAGKKSGCPVARVARSLRLH
eukprot:gb/GEZN01008093.1/.p1 GENE.gb/GEZN01008093.1/~~gb/GEZN01008093.1/.p1  ORF type:complete len:336 (-),score=24.54 gb/GEZN01008093.1/:438-1445(-)